MEDGSSPGGRDAPRAGDGARASDEQFRKLVEQAPDGIVISRDGKIIYANPAAVTLLGYHGPDELMGRSMATFLDAASFAAMGRRIQQMRQTGERLTPREYAAKRRDGTVITAEISSIFIQYDGAPAVLAFARDVTERVRLRAQLEQADRLAALGRLAAGVAHEINNPLAFMMLTAEALARRLAGGADGEARALVADLRSGVERIASVARDLRVYGRYEEESPCAVDLAAVLQHSERLAAHELRPRIDFRVEHEGLPLVRGVPMRLEQVFVNLLLNAAHAIPDERNDGRVVVRARRRERDVMVEVEDNGVGIPAELTGRVFEPFFTTRPAHLGTGLGLSICRDIVLRAGGTLTVDSEVDRGTIMRVTLQLVDESEAPRVAEPSPPSPPSLSGARRRILVIDDEPLVASMVSETLGETHDVVFETRSSDGLARILDDGTFDLVLCDLMMPGMSGMDLYHEVARQLPGRERRLAFLTGGAYTPRAQAFLEQVSNARLMKPFTTSQLEALVDAAASPG